MTTNLLTSSNVTTDIESKVVKIKTTEAEIKELQEQIKQLQMIAKAKQNEVENTEKEISDYMVSTGNVDMRVSYFHVFFMESEAIDVKDVKSLPEKFQRVKVEADKIGLKKALQSGEVIEGVTIIKNTSLQIR